MNGPEHYKEAELFLAKAANIAATLASLGDSLRGAELLVVEAGERTMLTVTARAQVHAALAQVEAINALTDRLSELGGAQ